MCGTMPSCRDMGVNKMNLYVYDISSKEILLEIENVVNYTENKVITEEGTVYAPFVDDVEFSSLPDCSEALRSDWRNSQAPTPEERIAVLEEQLVQADETSIALYEAQEAQEVINAQQDEALMEIYEMIG